MPYYGCRYFSTDSSVCLRKVAEGQEYCALHHEMLSARSTPVRERTPLDAHLERDHGNGGESVHAHRIEGPGV